MAIGNVSHNLGPVRAPMFSFEEKRESRAGAFLGSFLLQSIAVATLLLITVAGPKVIERGKYNRVELVAPPSEVEFARPRPHLPPPPQILPTPRAEEPPPLPVPVLPTKAPTLPTQALVKVVPAVKSAPAFETPTAKPEVAIIRHIETNAFSAAESAATKKPQTVVAAAGFGNPAGATPGKSAAGHSVPSLGAFEGEQGGKAAQPRAHGTVASGGFGDGSAVAVLHGSAGRVEQAGFGSVPVALGTPKHMSRNESQIVPVAIASKPTPVYSVEARRLRIEGEVLVSVVFSANGTVKVLGVTKGLGHGLDEAAIVAARGVRFVPAMRDGQKVDSEAVLHIVFALS